MNWLMMSHNKDGSPPIIGIWRVYIGYLNNFVNSNAFDDGYFKTDSTSGSSGKLSLTTESTYFHYLECGGNPCKIHVIVD
jgi:hypothetical protein